MRRHSVQSFHREIAFSCIVIESHDAFGVPQFGGFLGYGGQGCSGGNASQNAFFFNQPASVIERIFSGNAENAVEYRKIERLGDKSGADTLNGMRTRMASGNNRRVFGFHPYDQNGRKHFL